MSMFDKYSKWRDAVERMLADGEPKSKEDLILNVTTMRGRKLRHGIPNKAYVNIILGRDKRFTYKGKDYWGLTE